MAKQRGPFIWVKTFGCVSFYVRCGVGCVRMKSNLTGERWRSDPAFEGSRRSAACMALSAPLASSFYKMIPLQHRSYPHYKQLVGVAQHMLCKGYNLKQVNKTLNFTVRRFLRKHQINMAGKPLRSPFAATLSLDVKPAFRSLAPLQAPAPLFTVATFSTATTSQWPETIPPRGSPATITGYIRTNRISYQPLSALLKPQVPSNSNSHP